jgi:predicted dehydrogenase
MPLKIAIVGCGKIADTHATQITRIPGCEIVGVCDREELMARQLFDRFPVRRYYSSLAELLTVAQPDVVHVTTPPQGHFPVARQCLEHGCHVYVEKPFTLNTAEAAALVALAQSRNVKLTVGHDAQFSHAAQRLRAMIRDGRLGGTPLHMESYYGYEFGSMYGNALLGDKRHWVRRLPGKLLQNIISHGIARLAEYLEGDDAEVIAHSFISPELRRAGEDEIVDELRVIVRDTRGTTAYFTFSSRMRPALHQFRVYGPAAGAVLDEDQQTVVYLRGKRFKSYVEKFVPPLQVARQQLGNVLHNGRRFLANDFHIDAGKKHLIEQFYRAIAGGPLPISYREILLTSRIMDAIFHQVHGALAPVVPSAAAATVA